MNIADTLDGGNNMAALWWEVGWRFVNVYCREPITLFNRRFSNSYYQRNGLDLPKVGYILCVS